MINLKEHTIVTNQLRFKTPMLRSDLCNYNDAYIAVKEIITARPEEKDRDERNRQIVLKNNAPFY